VFLDMPAMQQPEAYIGNAGKMFDDNGGIAVESTREFMQKFLAAFEKWIERNAVARPPALAAAKNDAKDAKAAVT